MPKGIKMVLIGMSVLAIIGMLSCLMLAIRLYYLDGSRMPVITMVVVNLIGGRLIYQGSKTFREITEAAQSPQGDG